MKRRNFLKFLALTAVTPKVAVEVLSKVGPVAAPPIKAVLYGGARRGGKAIPGDIYAKQLKKVYGEAIIEMFNKHTMLYDRFAKEDLNRGLLHTKKGYRINLQKYRSKSS